jgi:hypothetical protein
MLVYQWVHTTVSCPNSIPITKAIHYDSPDSQIALSAASLHFPIACGDSPAISAARIGEHVRDFRSLAVAPQTAFVDGSLL